LGEPLSLGQEQVVLRGHAIECRINAEDVGAGFLPAPARVTAYSEPSGPGVRVDSGVAAGNEVSGAYDPMIAKLIVHGVDREHARMRMLRALDEFVIAGPKTLIGFHKALLSHECFVRGETCHGLVESDEMRERAATMEPEASPAPASKQAAVVPIARDVEVNGKRFNVRVLQPEQPWRELARRHAERVRAGGAGGGDAVVSPMQGTVLSVAVAEGDAVEAGAVICIIEAMKMENEVRAHRGGVVAELGVSAGDAVGSGQAICRIE
jgi:acetyl-CoA/propionyl-CoA carboxylase, biotin carboxylase, biotin carboxyl carrier protein